MTENAQDFVQRLIDDGAIPGGVLVISRAGQRWEDSTAAAAGSMSLDGRPMPADAIVRVQSMTKPITTAATLLAVQQGDLSLEDPVHRWLPELSHRSVLRSAEAELDDVVPAARDITARDITVRDLLINGCGYGMEVADTPLARGMADRWVDASPDQDVGIGAGEWLRRLATLPLAHQPGDGFRHHHGFGVLGVLLQRMSGGGFYAGAPVLDTAHGELVSTARDYLMFARMLDDGGRHEGGQNLDAALVTEMTRDQVAPVA